MCRDGWTIRLATPTGQRVPGCGRTEPSQSSGMDREGFFLGGLGLCGLRGRLNMYMHSNKCVIMKNI